MQRFTISLDDTLAFQFDDLIAAKGYVNRSEAVRDLIRTQLGDAHLEVSKSPWCAATISYIHDHHDRTLSERLQSLQHDHHDLVVSSLRTHLDHADCLETVVLRGQTKAVRAFSQTLVALRGVRHGDIHMIALNDGGHTHSHEPGSQHSHVHLKPIS